MASELTQREIDGMIKELAKGKPVEPDNEGLEHANRKWYFWCDRSKEYRRLACRLAELLLQTDTGIDSIRISKKDLEEGMDQEIGSLQSVKIDEKDNYSPVDYFVIRRK